LSELVGVSLGRTIRSKVYKLHKKRKKFPELKVIWVVL